MTLCDLSLFSTNKNCFLPLHLILHVTCYPDMAFAHNS